jgi:hypothetical protein
VTRAAAVVCGTTVVVVEVLDVVLDEEEVVVDPRVVRVAACGALDDPAHEAIRSVSATTAAPGESRRDTRVG